MSICVGEEMRLISCQCNVCKHKGEREHCELWQITAQTFTESQFVNVCVSERERVSFFLAGRLREA